MVIVFLCVVGVVLIGGWCLDGACICGDWVGIR